MDKPKQRCADCYKVFACYDGEGPCASEAFESENDTIKVPVSQLPAWLRRLTLVVSFVPMMIAQAFMVVPALWGAYKGLVRSFKERW